MWRMCCAALTAVGLVCLVTIPGVRADGYGSLKDEPDQAEEYVWDGLYVGVGVGIGSFDNSVDVDAKKKKTLKKRYCEEIEGYQCVDWGPWHTIWSPPPIKESASFGDDDWNLFGTMQVGFDRLIDKRVLIGAFADFDFGINAETSFSDTWTHSWGHNEHEIASIDGDVSLDHLWSIGGRLGILVTPRVLLYGVGGYAEGSLDGSVTVDFKHGPTLTLAAPDELQGYFVGGGAEIKLHRNVSVKLEYRYTDLDAEDSSDSKSWSKVWGCVCEEFKLTKTYNASADFDTEIQSVRAAIVLKFDEPERPMEPLK